MVLGIQLAFRAFGVPDVEVQYEARIQRTRQHHAPAVSWRQLSLWTPKWHPPKKKAAVARIEAGALHWGDLAARDTHRAATVAGHAP